MPKQGMNTVAHAESTIRTRKKYYLLFKVMIILVFITLIISFAIAIINFHAYSERQVNGYKHLLFTLGNSYLYEHVRGSENQLQALESRLNKQEIAAGGQVFTDVWPIVHKIKLEEDHHIFFYNAMSGRVDAYPLWVQPEHYDATIRPWYQLIEQHTYLPQWIGPYVEASGATRVLTLGKAITSDSGNTLGALMVDMPLSSIDKLLSRMVADDSITLFVRHDGSENTRDIISVVNPRLMPKVLPTAENTYSSLQGLKQGIFLRQPLSYVPWEIGIYVPVDNFRQAFMHEFVMLVIPISLIVLLSALGLRALLKIFRQELGLVEQEFTLLSENQTSQLDKEAHNAWFVDRSISVLKEHYKTYHLSLRLDPLTKIFNRRAFDEDMALAVQHNTHFVLVLIDVDRFKLINDTWGHAFGDVVLRRVSGVLAEELGVAHVYRIGGDEFAAILPLQGRALTSVLEQLQTVIRALRWRENSCRVTLSMGVANGPQPTAVLFEQADQALYKSKSVGRNCWHYFTREDIREGIEESVDG